MSKKFRLISIVLVFMLAISIPMTSFGAAYSTDASTAYTAKIKEKLNFEKILDVEGASIQKIARKGNSSSFEYTLCDGTVGKAVETASKNSKTFVVTEGEITNELVIFDNGKILLDGKPVKLGETEIKIYNTDETVSTSTTDSPICAAGGHYNVAKYFDQCPYGGSSYYKYHLEHISKNVEFSNKVKNIATSVLLSLFVAAFIAMVPMSASAAAASGIAGTVFTSAVLELKKKTPESMATRIEIERYQHSSSSARIPSEVSGETRFAWKDNIDYYAEFSNGDETHYYNETKYFVNKIKG